MSKKTTSVALSIKDADNVPAILAVVNEQISNLKKIETTTWKTSGELEGFGNIKNETNVSTLIKAFSSVLGRSTMYEKAANELGLKTCPVFSIGGTIEEWKHDIQLRIAIIEQDSEMKRLTTFRDKMSKFISEAEQKEMLLQEFIAGK